MNVHGNDKKLYIFVSNFQDPKLAQSPRTEMRPVHYVDSFMATYAISVVAASIAETGN